MRAAALGDLEVVRLLLAAGPDLDRTDYTGRTALDNARDGRRSKVVEALLRAGAR